MFYLNNKSFFISSTFLDKIILLACNKVRVVAQRKKIKWKCRKEKKELNIAFLFSFVYISNFCCFHFTPSLFFLRKINFFLYIQFEQFVHLCINIFEDILPQSKIAIWKSKWCHFNMIIIMMMIGENWCSCNLMHIVFNSWMKGVSYQAWLHPIT